MAIRALLLIRHTVDFRFLSLKKKKKQIRTRTPHIEIRKQHNIVASILMNVHCEALGILMVKCAYTYVLPVRFPYGQGKLHTQCVELASLYFVVIYYILLQFLRTPKSYR